MVTLGDKDISRSVLFFLSGMRLSTSFQKVKKEDAAAEFRHIVLKFSFEGLVSSKCETFPTLETIKITNYVGSEENEDITITPNHYFALSSLPGYWL